MPLCRWRPNATCRLARWIGSSSRKAAAQEDPPLVKEQEQNDEQDQRTRQKDKHELPRLLQLRRPVTPPVIFSTSGAVDKTVHILGIDEKSKFLAHVLRDSYDRVEFVSQQGPNKYTNIVYNRFSPPVPNRALADDAADAAQPGGGPIIDLVTTDATIGSLDRLKGRLSDRSTICVLQDGLGLAEQAAEEVFTDATSRPTFLLGHMPRTYQYDRRTMSVRQMPRQFAHKNTYLTRASPLQSQPQPQPPSQQPPSQQPPPLASRLVHSFEASSQLHGRILPYDHWLRMKLPSMVFTSVVDPVCTVLNCRYEQLMGNARGLRMMDQLLGEISAVILHLPETQASPELLRAFSSERIRQHVLGQLRGKGQAASPMAVRVQAGKWTDIDYLNGYFVRKGKLVGVDASANRLAINLVKARMYQRRKTMEAWVPWEETSRREN